MNSFVLGNITIANANADIPANGDLANSAKPVIKNSAEKTQLIIFVVIGIWLIGL